MKRSYDFTRLPVPNHFNGIVYYDNPNLLADLSKPKHSFIVNKMIGHALAYARHYGDKTFACELSINDYAACIIPVRSEMTIANVLILGLKIAYCDEVNRRAHLFNSLGQTDFDGIHFQNALNAISKTNPIAVDNLHLAIAAQSTEHIEIGLHEVIASGLRAAKQYFNQCGVLNASAALKAVQPKPGGKTDPSGLAS